MNRLERAARHLDRLIENGLLDAIDRRLEEYELTETEHAVSTQHVGKHVYQPPGEEQLEADYADAFKYAVEEVHRRLWPVEPP